MGRFASHREGQRPRCPIRRHTGNEDVAPPISLPLILYFPLTSTGFDCVAAFVSLPALSAVWWDCVITAMPGMPKAYTLIVCVLSLGVRLEQPLAKLTMPPPIAPSSTGQIAAQS